jgi:glycine/sarcosine N-methyltransferase
MNDINVYDQFSEDYDRFVNWDARLALELPFLTAQLAAVKAEPEQMVSVLDVACGTGQHVIALAKEGFDVTGADFSVKMVALAQENAHIAGMKLTFKQAGFGQLADSFGKQTFDSLICLGNSLPHVLNEEMMLCTLEDFKSVLRPGGNLIIQNRNFDLVVKQQVRWMEPQTYREQGKTWIFVRFYDFDPDGRITFHILTLTQQYQEDFQQRIVSTRLWPVQQVQLVEYLKLTGFGDISLYGDLQGTPFDMDKSGNLVITART